VQQADDEERKDTLQTEGEELILQTKEDDIDDE